MPAILLWTYTEFCGARMSICLRGAANKEGLNGVAPNSTRPADGLQLRQDAAIPQPRYYGEVATGQDLHLPIRF